MNKIRDQCLLGNTGEAIKGVEPVFLIVVGTAIEILSTLYPPDYLEVL